LTVHFGRTLARLLEGRRALIVASSDLSHYPPAKDAVGVDRRTLTGMATLNVDRLRAALDASMTSGIRELVTAACGEAPVMAAMTAAAALGATRGRIVSYANSADLPVGDSARVVGYGAVAFSAGDGVPASNDAPSPPVGLDRPAPSSPQQPLPAADRKLLLALARSTITRYLESGTLTLGRPVSPGLEREQGAFVTLRKKGELRGCIGQLTPNGPLRRLVGTMALGAAFEDPRFPRVQANELKDIEVEVSVLTPFREVPSAASILPGRDGVLLRKGRSTAVFLPQVASEEGWDRNELLDNLCIKAGLARGCWQTGAKLSTFQADVFKESEFVR
jgi:AmmeMemoRadiSam system protein A